MNKLVTTADSIGMATSVACLAHCLAMPLLVSFLPLLSVQEESIHVSLSGLMLLAFASAIIPGFLKHRRWMPLVLGSAGLAVFFSAILVWGPRYGELIEIIASGVAGILLFTAHLDNRRCCSACDARRIV